MEIYSKPLMGFVMILNTSLFGNTKRFLQAIRAHFLDSPANTNFFKYIYEKLQTCKNMLGLKT